MEAFGELGAQFVERHLAAQDARSVDIELDARAKEEALYVAKRSP